MYLLLASSEADVSACRVPAAGVRLPLTLWSLGPRRTPGRNSRRALTSAPGAS